MPKFIDPHIAATRLNVCVRTIYRMIRDGQLAAVKVRSRWKIKEVSLQVLIEKQKECTRVY